MGASCCCMRLVDFDEYENPSRFIYRHCSCLGCFIQQFLILYTTVFQRRDLHTAPSIQGATPLPSSGLSAGSLDSSFPDTYHAPPRPLPYDTDPRYTRLQPDRLASRHEKTSSRIHEESQPLRRSNSIAGLESVVKTDKGSGSDREGGYFDGGSTVFCSESSVKHSSTKITREVAYFLSSSEDEDVCPTCLEEYTPENPKITTQCSHHFHLGCIYEWMERSETCPVCGKVMVFNETA